MPFGATTFVITCEEFHPERMHWDIQVVKVADEFRPRSLCTSPHCSANLNDLKNNSAIFLKGTATVGQMLDQHRFQKTGIDLVKNFDNFYIEYRCKIA